MPYILHKGSTCTMAKGKIALDTYAEVIDFLVALRHWDGMYVTRVEKVTGLKDITTEAFMDSEAESKHDEGPI